MYDARSHLYQTSKDVYSLYIHLYSCHPLVLSSPTLMMHGHTNLKFTVASFPGLFDRRQCYEIPGSNLANKCRMPDNRAPVGP